MTLGKDNGTDGQTDGQTDRQTDRRTDRVRRNMRPPPREEGRIINDNKQWDVALVRPIRTKANFFFLKTGNFMMCVVLAWHNLILAYASTLALILERQPRKLLNVCGCTG